MGVEWHFFVGLQKKLLAIFIHAQYMGLEIIIKYEEHNGILG